MLKNTISGLNESWNFPTSRYRGSKRKILPWIMDIVEDLQFDTVLDLFGGTGLVSMLFKRMSKQVTFNDYLKYNYSFAVALIENSGTYLTDEDLKFILPEKKSNMRGGFITDTFKGFYFTVDENKWIDATVENIFALDSVYSGITLKQKQAIATWSLGQACLIKRPFNLFHRKNLNLRMMDVSRTFGNKTTWETPFPDAMKRFTTEANLSVFDNCRENKALCGDAFKLKQNGYDLVYLDPPYFCKNQRDYDYREMYHFLEGLSQYHEWEKQIDFGSSNLRLKREAMRWPHSSVEGLTELFSKLIERFSDSIIVISHKSGSLVSSDVLKKLLIKHGKQVSLHKKPYKYALSRKNGKPDQNIECLFVGV